MLNSESNIIPDHQTTSSEKRIVKPSHLWNIFRQEILQKDNPNIYIIGTDTKALLTQAICTDLKDKAYTITIIEGNQKIIDLATETLKKADIKNVNFIHGMFPDNLSSEFDDNQQFDLILGSYLIRHIEKKKREHFILSALNLLSSEAPLGLSSFPVEDIGLAIEFKSKRLSFTQKSLPIPFGSVFIFRKNA